MQLVPVHQQLPGAQRFMVEDVAMFVRPNVRINQPQFAVFHQAIGVFQIGPSSADGLDLGAAQGDAGLELVQQKVVVRRSPVHRRVALAAGDRIAPDLFLFLRTGRRWYMTSHTCFRSAVALPYASQWNAAERTGALGGSSDNGFALRAERSC